MSETSIERLTSVRLHDGEAALSWFGQASFAARGGGVTVLFDPFLSAYRTASTRRRSPPRKRRASMWCSARTSMWIIWTTERRGDRGVPRAVFVVPSPIVDMVTEAGVPEDRVVGLQPGGATDVAGLSVRAIPACHGVTMADAYGFGRELSGGLVRFLGFVVDLGGVRLYHAGDTIHFDGMVGTLTDLAIDVALLPINGRDAEREARDLVGNLDHREAAWLGRRSGPASWCRCTTTCSRATWDSQGR